MDLVSQKHRKRLKNMRNPDPNDLWKTSRTCENFNWQVLVTCESEYNWHWLFTVKHILSSCRVFLQNLHCTGVKKFIVLQIFKCNFTVYTRYKWVLHFTSNFWWTHFTYKCGILHLIIANYSLQNYPLPTLIIADIIYT